jgi:hypothetical protein
MKAMLCALRLKELLGVATNENQRMRGISGPDQSLRSTLYDVRVHAPLSAFSEIYYLMVQRFQRKSTRPKVGEGNHLH